MRIINEFKEKILNLSGLGGTDVANKNVDSEWNCEEVTEFKWD